MFGIFDVYLLEAVINGILLGGVFALLALGLNLVFGVIDVVWICYAELIMLGMVALYLFLARSYTGAAIRAVAQDRQIMPLMGVDTRRIYIVTSLIGGGLAGLAACLLVLQYDVQPFVGLTFGPITFLICVLGGLGNMIGGVLAALLFVEILSVSGLSLSLPWGYVFSFCFFCSVVFFPPPGAV